MNKRDTFILVVLTALGVFFAPLSHAVWIWTPETKKWINPKYAVKENPEEQFAWAESLFQAEDYKDAIKEHRKLIKNYPDSIYAPRSQYAIGDCWEALGEYQQAVDEYQKVIDNYPTSDKVAEVVESQYRIGNIFFGEEIKSKFKKVFVESNYEKAAKVYRLVIKNAPYSSRAPEVQYRIGLCYLKGGGWSEAISEYEKVIENYPESQFVERAFYEIGLSCFNQSLSPLYDQTMTEEALKHFKEFRKRFPESSLSKEVQGKINSLRERKAERIYKIGQFYEKQGSTEAAGIYYQEIVDDYPDIKWARSALERLNELKTTD
ncbi:outer membrane protein assembly factor BamD [bacterium]|nr:outer membrane protein assembly factor BamD [bacterium]